MSPSWNTSTPKTGINASTPAASPNPPFTEMSENTRRSRRRVVHHFDGRRDHPGMFVIGLPWFRERPPDTREQQRGQRERHGVDHEGGVAAEDRRHDAAHRRTDREHRAPQRPAQGVRGRQIRRVHQVRDRGRRGRIERRTEDRQHRQQRVRQPDGARSDEQEGGADGDTSQVAPDHELAAVEAVGQHAGERRRQEEGHLLSEDGEADVDRRRPVVSRISPVIATNRNQSPPSEITDARNRPSEVAVPPEQGEAGAKPGWRYSSSSHWLNVAGRFSRNAGAPSIASWWKSLMAVRAAMSSPAWSKVRCAAL